MSTVPPAESKAQPKSAESTAKPPLSHFAPAERVSEERLNTDVEQLAGDPVVDALMRAVGGLLAVLNEQRQVLAVNDRLLRLLGLQNAATTLGLRLGEALHCVHAGEMPAGCGTSTYCSTCGAAIAQVTSLARDHAVERVCAIDIGAPIGGLKHLYFRVQACPIRRGSRRLLLLFLQDISEDQERAALDRTFFHDVKNTLTALVGAGEILAQDGPQADPRMADNMVQMVRRLAREIELHRCLVTAKMDRFEQSNATVVPAQALAELEQSFANHSCLHGRSLRITPPPANAPALTIDPTMLQRILQNMVINALEDTPEDGEARVWIELPPGTMEFCVWNAAVMPPAIARRVFQRNFSTKGTLGRGLGTFSMKLLSERVPGSQVSFTSREGEGTCFRFRMPTAPAPAPA